MKYLHLFAIALFLLSSCSEDPVTTTADTKPYIEVYPDSLTGITYTSYTFKARLHNFPFGEVSYTWYFSEGDTTLRKIDNIAAWQYDKPGKYTLSVIAYDTFADTTIATKLVPITIIAATPQVSLSPSTHDTTVTQLIDGTFEYFSFKVNTNLPSYNAVFHWHFSEVPSDTIVYNSEYLGYRFPTTGIHHVSVDVYDQNGTYWGSDSTTINVRTETVTQEMLSNSTQAEVLLYSVPILDDSLDYIPYIVSGVKKGKNLSTIYNINNNIINCITIDTSVSQEYHRIHQVRLSGQFSGNLSKIEHLRIESSDSTSTYDTLRAGNILSFDLKNISLFAITRDYIIYMAHNKPFSSYAENIDIVKLSLQYFAIYSNYGQVNSDHFSPLIYATSLQYETEYALIVFSRK